MDDYPKSADQIGFATLKKPILDALLMGAEGAELAHQKDVEEAKVEYESMKAEYKARRD